MTWSKTPGFQTLCRFVLCFFLLSLLHPATLGMQSPPSFAARTAGPSHWLLDVWRWLSTFGPTPAYAQDALLASTPDANTSDPFIIAKAAELGHDAQRLFAFVRDEIGYESYKGSLRGARGTLWSKAGNALDKASLLIALLRASGVPARYVQGTLSDALAKDLILSMFPPICDVIGIVPEGIPLSDSANDPQLLTETREHYWAEFNTGGGFQTADPTFKDAQIGHAFAPAQGTFAEVPDNLRHKVTVRLKVEITEIFTGFSRVTPEIKTPLNATFNAVALVGKPLSIGHFVNSFSPPALLFGYITHTYSPYLLIQQNDLDVLDDPIIRGEDYQEFLSNFPLTSRLITGLFLEIDSITPDSQVKTFEKVLADRIGFAIRQNGGSPTLNISANEQPLITELDSTTLNINGALEDESWSRKRVARIQELSVQAGMLDSSRELDLQHPEDQSLLEARAQFSQRVILLRDALSATQFSVESDKTVSRLEREYLTRAYLDSLRIIIAGTRIERGGSNPLSLKSYIDVRTSKRRTISRPGQAQNASFLLNVAKGVEENVIETELAEQFGLRKTAVSTINIFKEAEQEGVRITLVANIGDVQALDIPMEAKARLVNVVNRGSVVLIPNRSVIIDSKPVVAWFEFNLENGETVGVTEDGGHQGFTEFVFEYLPQLVQSSGAGGFFGIIGGGLITIASDIANVVCSCVADSQKKDVIRTLGLFAVGSMCGASFVNLDRKIFSKVFAIAFWNDIENGLFKLKGTFSDDEWRKALKADPPTRGTSARLKAFGEWGLYCAAGVGVWAGVQPFLQGDPPVPGYLLGLSSCDNANPGTEPGVSLEVVPDTLFTLPFEGALLPFAFRARVRNLGNTEASFALSFPTVPNGFRAVASLSKITIPASASSEVGVYLEPVGQIPAPGTELTFGVKIANIAHPEVSSEFIDTFHIPEIPRIVLTSDPPIVTTSVGSSAFASVTLNSVGNASAWNISLELDVPSGLTVHGLQTPVTLGVGESVTQFLTLTPSNSTSMTGPQFITITATFETLTTGEQIGAGTQIGVQVVASEGQSAVEASFAAGKIGRTGLGVTLNVLGVDLTELSQDPNNERFQSRAVALLDSLIAQLNTPALTPFIPDLAAARGALAAATTPDGIQGALSDLSAALTGLADVLSAAARPRIPFTVALQPNSATVLPNTPASYALALQNTGTDTATYHLSLSPLPPGVTGGLSRDTVTLAPGEAIPRPGGPNVTVTLTQSPDTLFSFDFTVSVSTQATSGTLTRSVQGTLHGRNEVVEVVAVEVDPAATDPGTPVNVSARLLNVVNQDRQVRVGFTVKDATGAVIFTSAPQNAALTVLSPLVNVALGALDTTGLAVGGYTVEVTVTDTSGQPVPGGVGQGHLLLGAPVSATLTLDRDVLPPGDTTVTATLALHSRVPLPDPQAVLLGAVGATQGTATGVALNGNVAYLCTTEAVDVVDISNPVTPRVLRTIATNVAGFFPTCYVADNRLIVVWQGSTFNVSRLTVDIYGLSNPAQPQLLGSTNTTYQFATGAFVHKDHVFVSTQGTRVSGAVTDHFGDFLAFDISDSAAPRFADLLFNTSPSPEGGEFNVKPGVAVNDQLALVPTTTIAGSNTQGVGRLLVVDISQPGNLSIVRSVPVPGTVHLTGVTIQGHLALVVGSSGARGAGGALTGNLTLTTLDITDPRAPVILHTMTTSSIANHFARPVSLGNGYFSVSQGSVNNATVLLLVDAHVPDALEVTPIAVPALANDTAVAGNRLYTTSSAGLRIYDLGPVVGTRFTARVQIPKHSGVGLVSGSWRIAPTTIIPGPDVDTLVWERALSAARSSESLTWQSNVTRLQPGEARKVTLATTIDFTTSSAATGQLTIPPRVVVSDQILTLTPTTRTVRPGEVAPYSLLVQNPTTAAVTYNLSVQGIPEAWIDLPPSVTVPAQGTASLTLRLRADAFAGSGARSFVVTASSNTGAQGSVYGNLRLDGLPVFLDAVGPLDTLLQTLAQDLNNLTQNPSSTALKTRLLTSLNALIGRLDDPVLTSSVAALLNLRDTLTSATPDAIPGLLQTLSSQLTTLPGVLADLTNYRFAVALRPNSAVALPQTPAHFALFLHNTGTVPATYTFSLSPLPAGVSGAFDRTEVTLAPGEAIPRDGGPNVTLTLTSSAEQLLVFDFTVTVAVTGVPNVVRTAQGTMTAREELVDIVAVQAQPSFTDAGGQVAVSVRLLNAVNQSRTARLLYTVHDPAGAVVFTSAPQDVALTVLSSLDTIALQALDTTGFAPGSYTIAARVLDTNGQPLTSTVGQGRVLIGSPLSAAMRVEPETLPPGDGTVTTTLTLTSLTPLPTPQIRLLGLVDTVATATSVALKDNLAYVCGTEDVTIVDVSEPTAPRIVGTFADTLIVGGVSAFCRISGNHLVVMWQRGTGSNVLPIDVFRLDNPTQPTLVRNTSVNYHFITSLFLAGDYAFATMSGVNFNTVTNAVLGQFGDFLAFDLSDIENPRLVDVLFNTDGAPDGGNFNMRQGVALNSQLALVASTTSTGSQTQSGVGRLLVVDISDPANLFVVQEVLVPGTRHLTGLGIQGNLALIVGNTEGTRNPGNPDFSLTGNVTLTSIDLTDPLNPVLLSTLPTAGEGNATRVSALGNGFFSVSGTTFTHPVSGADEPVLMLVDTNDPIRLTFTNLPVPARLQESLVRGNMLFTTSAAGLGIYDIGDVVGTRVTAQVRIPHQTGVQVIPGSFTIDPTAILPGNDFDTLVWERSLAATRTGETYTWQSRVTEMAPGTTREVTLGATVDFTIPSGDAGQIVLPPLMVASDHILALMPAERTARPGEAVTYTLLVRNPTAGPVTYILALQGVPRSWVVDFPPVVAVPAQGTTQIAVVLKSDAAALAGSHGFVVTASADTGARSVVHGALLLAGAPVLEPPIGVRPDVGQDVPSVARGVVLELTPGQAIAGQGTTARYVVRVINTGNATETFALTGLLPAGVQGSLGQQNVEVPPGLSNFREVALAVTPTAGTPAGDYPFTVTAVSTAAATVQSQAIGTIRVAGQGVQVAFSPPAGVPGSTLQLTVTNTGQGEDTFDLALGGPLAPFATPSATAVTLARGASQTLSVQLDPVNIALPGTLELIAVATSRGNTAVQSSATAAVTIATTQSLRTSFTPGAMELAVPGTAAFLLVVDNTGNVEEAYKAAITASSGPVTASLNGLNGQATPEVPLFRLPGLATGAVLLNAQLLAPGAATVTVTVTSLSNPAVRSSSTAMLRTPNQAPLAAAGPDQAVYLGDTVQLNGQGSVDPDHSPAALTFQWRFGVQPNGSALPDSAIQNATTALASFTPVVRGTYVLQLTVSDSVFAATDEVMIQVQNNPPVADAGPDRNVETGQPVSLNGSNSFDPDGDLITYAWSIEWQLAAKPPESALTDADLLGADTPTPTITPDVDGVYVFRLLVKDGAAESAPDFVRLTASTPNVPPNAQAGADRSSMVGEFVLLDGQGSHDPDAGPAPLSYLWTFDTVPVGSRLQDVDIATADQAQAQFVPDVPGLYGLTLEVFDGQDSDTDAVQITVTARNVPPNAQAGADQTVLLGDQVHLDGRVSTDPDQAPQALTFSWRFVSVATGSALTTADLRGPQTATPWFTPDVAGSYVLELQVFDGAAAAFDNVLVTVHRRNQPPVCTLASAQPAWLWPPNHKLVPVAIVGVTDPEQQPVTLTVTEVQQDEPVDGLGDGDTSPDAVLQAGQLLLRAERAGNGNGRVYHISFLAADNAGAQCRGSLTVCVPHDSRHTHCSDGGQRYDSTQRSHSQHKGKESDEKSRKDRDR